MHPGAHRPATTSHCPVPRHRLSPPDSAYIGPSSEGSRYTPRGAHPRYTCPAHSLGHHPPLLERSNGQRSLPARSTTLSPFLLSTRRYPPQVHSLRVQVTCPGAFIRPNEPAVTSPACAPCIKRRLLHRNTYHRTHGPLPSTIATTAI